jgi:Reverse transcriptase (RNA-dependent DNA polymerase)
MTIKPKWKPKAVQVTRVGYSKDHSSNTYVILKHDSNKYVKSRDIKWDEPRRYQKLTLEATRDPSKTAITPEWEQTIAEANRFASIISDEDDDDDSDDGEDSLSGNDTTAVAHDDQQQGGRLQHEMNRLAPHNNPGTGTVEGGLIGRTRQATGAMVNNVAVSDDVTPDNDDNAALLYKDPANDQEAMEGKEGKHWWDGLVKEYDGFFEIKTWKLIKHKDAKLGHGNKPLTTKNVYKKKVHAITKEPRYQVRNCIRGFEMIAGVHYDMTFAPTPMSMTVRTVFTLLYFLQQLGVSKEDLEQIEKEEWIIGDLFDIVQAFLNSELDPDKNPIYTYLPPYCKQYCEL